MPYHHMDVQSGRDTGYMLNSVSGHQQADWASRDTVLLAQKNGAGRHDQSSDSAVSAKIGHQKNSGKTESCNAFLVGLFSQADTTAAPLLLYVAIDVTIETFVGVFMSLLIARTCRFIVNSLCVSILLIISTFRLTFCMPRAAMPAAMSTQLLST